MGNYWLDLDKREKERAHFVECKGQITTQTGMVMPRCDYHDATFDRMKKATKAPFGQAENTVSSKFQLVDKKTKVRPLTLDQSVLWDSERVNSTDKVDFVMQFPSHNFTVENMKLVSSPNTWIDAPAEFQGMNLRWKVPVRLRYEPKREDAERLCDWLSGITDGIKELGTLVLYLKKENKLHEVWTLRDVYPKNISWEVPASAVEFSLGYCDLRQRVVRGGQSELLA